MKRSEISHGMFVKKPDGRKAIVQHVGDLINVAEDGLGEPAQNKAEFFSPEQLEAWEKEETSTAPVVVPKTKSRKNTSRSNKKSKSKRAVSKSK